MSAPAECVAADGYFSQKDLLDRPAVEGCISVDDIDTHLVDDAMSVDINEKDGTLHVGVHVVDGGIVKPDSQFFHNPKLRLTGHYNRRFTIVGKDDESELPTALFQHGFSLNNSHYGLGTPTVTFGFKLIPGEGVPDEERIVDLSITPTRIVDCLSTDYGQFEELIRSGDERALSIVGAARFLGQHIGATSKTPDNLAHYCVEQLMLAANHLVAREALRLGLPFIYRNQRKSRKASQKLVDHPTGPEEDIADTLVPIASFSTVPLGHESLKLNPYARVTSVLLQPDCLINHVILAAHRKGKESPFTIDQLNQWATELTLQHRKKVARAGAQAVRAFA